ncbi:MAG: response regulator transcription factor [Armatimonadota bacterium]|nr:response regulator transcription factor [Armatimonadota bacterium]MDR7485119.1 response regulator transcription factor [Armatimonadota bacterium]MDR7533507.1 response regulator transcription factor [Armatimonadota bacterium]MDR7536992.1 response regulator transcription factor [Armatimonadota bacterium]
MKILVVEDDARSRDLLVRYLTAKGHQVATADDGGRALAAVAADEPELVLLDVNLPTMDGWGVLEAVRKFSQVPVIMVTVHDTPQDKVAGLDLGADDYITKPFDLRELDARINAVARRAYAAVPRVIRAGDLTLDDERKEVVVRGRPVALSPKEYELLRLLASRPGKVFSTDEIVGAVWPDREAAAAEDVKKYVHMLRTKIEAHPGQPRIILTVRGFGYRFAPPGTAAAAGPGPAGPPAPRD